MDENELKQYFPSGYFRVPINTNTERITLSREEAASIVRELKHTYISHENPLAHDVYRTLEQFVETTIKQQVLPLDPK